MAMADQVAVFAMNCAAPGVGNGVGEQPEEVMTEHAAAEAAAAVAAAEAATAAAAGCCVYRATILCISSRLRAPCSPASGTRY